MTKEPTNHDLLIWYLYTKLDEVPYVESPDQIDQWFNEVRRSTINEIHKDLYENYKEFREKFNPPCIPYTVPPELPEKEKSPACRWNQEGEEMVNGK